MEGVQGLTDISGDCAVAFCLVCMTYHVGEGKFLRDAEADAHRFTSDHLGLHPDQAIQYQNIDIVDYRQLPELRRQYPHLRGTERTI